VSATTLNSRDHRHAYVRDILDNLNTFVVNLAPDAGIGNIAEGRKIDAGNELSARSCEDHDLNRAILRDAVESIDEFRVILRRKSEWPAVGPAQELATAERRKYATVRAELERLREWLKSEHCTHVTRQSNSSNSGRSRLGTDGRPSLDQSR